MFQGIFHLASSQFKNVPNNSEHNKSDDLVSTITFSTDEIFALPYLVVNKTNMHKALKMFKFISMSLIDQLI